MKFLDEVYVVTVIGILGIYLVRICVNSNNNRETILWSVVLLLSFVHANCINTRLFLHFF